MKLFEGNVVDVGGREKENDERVRERDCHGQAIYIIMMDSG